MHLKSEALRYQRVREALLKEWPHLDEETLADTLEGITDLHEMIAAVIRSALVDAALQSGLRARLEEMRQRLARLEERGAKKRQLALEAMCEVGLKKLSSPTSLPRRESGTPGVVVDLRRENPRRFLGAAAAKLDRQALLRRHEARRSRSRR